MRVLELLYAGSVIRRLKGEVHEFVGGVAMRQARTDPCFDHAVLIENDWLPLADHSFDLVLCDHGLEAMARPALVLAEVCRLLKPGGSFFFRTQNLLHYAALRARLAPSRLRKRFDPSTAAGSMFYRANTPSRLRRLAQDAGLSAVEFRMIEDEFEPTDAAGWASPLGARYRHMVQHFDRLAGLRATILGRMTR